MTQEHPITLPPELVQQLWDELRKNTERYGSENAWNICITQAARWGYEQRGAVNEAELQKARDEELEACCEWLHWQNLATHADLIPSLRAERRPKPPGLKEQALEALKHVEEGWRPVPDDCAMIRRALESLPD